MVQKITCLFELPQFFRDMCFQVMWCLQDDNANVYHHVHNVISGGLMCPKGWRAPVSPRSLYEIFNTFLPSALHMLLNFWSSSSMMSHIYHRWMNDHVNIHYATEIFYCNIPEWAYNCLIQSIPTVNYYLNKWFHMLSK